MATSYYAPMPPDAPGEGSGAATTLLAQPCNGNTVLQSEAERLRAAGYCAARRKNDASYCRERAGACGCHCGAKLRGERAGGFCPAHPVQGRERCRMHRGNAARGVAHRGFRGKGHSKDLPVRLGEDYWLAQDDAELLSLREEVALVRVRVCELLRRLDTGEAGGLWAALKAAWRAYRTVSPDAQEAALGRVGDLIDRGASDEAAWNQIFQAMKLHAVLASREWRRIKDLQECMTKQQALALITAIGLLVRDNVKDETALRAIADGIKRLVGRDPQSGDS